MSWLKRLLIMPGKANGKKSATDPRSTGLFDTCMEEKTKHVVVASEVGTYTVSPFAVHCRHFVEISEMDPNDPYMEQLSEHGSQHEDDVHEHKYPDAEISTFDTPEDGFKQSIDGMLNGDDTLLGCPLFYLPLGLKGELDVLEKTTGKSDFGDYHYIVKEIKLAKNIKKSHILQAAFYNLMIGKIQGHVPDTFYVINMDEEEFEFEFANYEDELVSAIEGINAILDGKVPSPVYGACPYPWRKYCDRKAMESRDVSLVSGIGSEKRKALEGRGLTTIDDMAVCGISDLMSMKGIGKKTATSYVLSARQWFQANR